MIGRRPPAASYTCATWTWTFAIIGLALRFLSNHSPVRRYIADSSYWLYLIHLPLSWRCRLPSRSWRGRGGRNSRSSSALRSR